MFNTDLDALIPMLCVTLTALATLGTEAFRGRAERLPMGWWGLIGLGGAALSAALLWNRNVVGYGVIVADNFGLFVTFILVVVGALTIMFSSQVVYRDGIPAGEYYALVLFSIVGMIMMATATDLLVIFIALEILSLAVYVLTGVRRESAKGIEGAFKYFLLGAFSSAFFLYGIAFTYGVAGSTRLEAVGSFLSAQALSDNPMILLAVGLLLVGFAFKISAVPFHMWTPDAYEGAPAIVTGFMSTGVKVAAFAAFTRVFLSAFEPFSGDWAPLVAWVAAATQATSGPQSVLNGSNAERNTRVNAANAATFTPVDMKPVTIAGAPSYASGVHMWNGTAEILKAKPTSSRPTASRIIGLSLSACAERNDPTASSRVLPATP